MPIRLRIALATTVIMMLSLVVVGSGVYFVTSRGLHGDVDVRLRSVYESYSRNPGQIRIAADGRPTLATFPEPFASSGVYIQVLDSRGNVGARSENLGQQIIPVEATTLERNAAYELVYYTIETDHQELRVLSARLPQEVIGPFTIFVQVAEPLGPVNDTLAGLRQTLIVGSLLATMLLGVAAWMLGDAVMRPLARMSNTARAIGRTSDLSRRIDPPQTKDEVQRLAETFNDMLSRLEETFSAQRRFLADASHELRTPLTALRANSDIMLRQIEAGILDADQLTEGLTDMRDEVDRMSRLVHNLLMLARADVGWRPELERVEVVEVVRDAARIAAPLVKGHQFDVVLPAPGEGDDGSLDVWGNADQLRQLLLILLDNAFTYAPAGTRVALAAGASDDQIIMSVSDSGPGIPPEHLKRIFERFYRTDDARTRSSGGAGLGLAIARWIVSVHDGDISVASRPGQGTTFTIRLPRPAANAPDAQHAQLAEPVAAGQVAV
jgi:two-component system, OmpR family, sensor kinase